MSDNGKQIRSRQPATKMKQETHNFLNFIDQELNPGTITIDKWKEYLKRLPQIYKSDIGFQKQYGCNNLNLLLN